MIKTASLKKPLHLNLDMPYYTIQVISKTNDDWHIACNILK